MFRPLIGLWEIRGGRSVFPTSSKHAQPDAGRHHLLTCTIISRSFPPIPPLHAISNVNSPLTAVVSTGVDVRNSAYLDECHPRRGDLAVDRLARRGWHAAMSVPLQPRSHVCALLALRREYGGVNAISSVSRSFLRRHLPSPALRANCLICSAEEAQDRIHQRKREGALVLYIRCHATGWLATQDSSNKCRC